MVNYKTLILFVITSSVASFLLGFYSYVSKSREVNYVSLNEIIDFEYDRISRSDNPKEKDLFYGYEDAADLVMRVASSLNDKGKITLFSKDKVYGRNVKSVSREVYDLVMMELNSGTKNSDNKY
jgi:hypothetical protein